MLFALSAAGGSGGEKRRYQRRTVWQRDPGQKVGIIGCGQIGFMTAKLFQAFGAEVYAYARHEREEVKAAGIAYKPLDDLLRECDIISLHTPNNKETRGMISAEKIALMKKSAILSTVQEALS